jgi:hypothetical protein
MTSSIQGITEDDIANYLANTPGFFERHAELLASIQLASPHGQRAVSLQERQMEMLRERSRAGAAHHGHDPPQTGERRPRRPTAPLDRALMLVERCARAARPRWCWTCRSSS